jgi:methylthioribulose-1-phosphate dehydratase
MNKDALAKSLADLIVEFNKRGWSAATGTNYSFRTTSADDTYWVSQSGKDKAYFSKDDFMHVHLTGEVCPSYEHLKPSAENLLHAVIYQNSSAQVVLHSHSVNATILSQYFLDKSESYLRIQGYEVQKAITGITSHEQELLLPLFQNTQNMHQLKRDIEDRWELCSKAVGFAIGNHGIYTWGKDLATAKRHLEAYEFLLECMYKRMLLNK